MESSTLTRTLVRQALHFSLGLTFAEIARLTGGDAVNVRKQIFSGTWQTQTNEARAAAITRARQVRDSGLWD